MRYDTGVQAEPGSVLEFAYVLLFQKRLLAKSMEVDLSMYMSIDHADSRKTGIEVRQNLRNLWFPYAEKTAENRDEKMREELMRWAKKGPMKVTPLSDITLRKRDVRRAPSLRGEADSGAINTPTGKKVSLNGYMHRRIS